MSSLNTFDINESQRFHSKFSTSSNVIKVYNDVGLTSIVQDIHRYLQESTAFTEQEIKNYFMTLNQNWSVAFNLLERSDVRSARLSTVGNYIACHQLSSLTGTDVDLDVFYK